MVSPLNLTCRTLLVVLALGLSACSSTVFVQLPAGTVADCDERFVGTWRMDTPGDSPAGNDEPEYVSVEAGCTRIVGTDVAQAAHEDLREDTELRFVRAGRHDYVATRDLEDDGGDEGEDEGRRGDEGWTLHRITFRGKDRIELHEVDHARASELVRTGKFVGSTRITTPKQGETTFDNVIDSEPEALARVLGDRKLFQRKAMMVLSRVDPDELRLKLQRAKEQSGAREETGDGFEGGNRG